MLDTEFTGDNYSTSPFESPAFWHPGSQSRNLTLFSVLLFKVLCVSSFWKFNYDIAQEGFFFYFGVCSASYKFRPFTKFGTLLDIQTFFFKPLKMTKYPCSITNLWEATESQGRPNSKSYLPHKATPSRPETWLFYLMH